LKPAQVLNQSVGQPLPADQVSIQAECGTRLPTPRGRCDSLPVGQPHPVRPAGFRCRSITAALTDRLNSRSGGARPANGLAVGEYREGIRCPRDDDRSSDGRRVRARGRPEGRDRRHQG
jgi:hypothetical protein